MPKPATHSDMEKKHIDLKDFINKLTIITHTMSIRIFHFNPIQVNTIVLSDNESGEAVIIDPGNCNLCEDSQLQEYIHEHNLLVKYILNTHPHIDHIAGNDWCVKEYRVPLRFHAAGMPIYEKAFAYAAAFGIEQAAFPLPTTFIKEGDVIKFGHQQLEVLYTPGHCDGSVSFLNRAEKYLICGDLIFEGSVGRSDLPTGNGELLLQMIREKIMVLEDEITIYPGHGDATTVGNEKLNNPYLQ